MMMIKNYIKATVAGAVVAVLASCSVDFTTPLYGPDGALLIYPGRVDISAETGGAQGSYTLTILDSKGNDVTGITSGRWIDLEAGGYTLVGYSNDGLFNRSGSILQLKDVSGAGLVALPSGIIGGAAPFTITEDETASGTVTIAPLTRKLRVEIELLGADLANVASISSWLNGLASSVDLLGGFGSVPGTSAGSGKVQLGVRSEDGLLIIEVELLGVVLSSGMEFRLEGETLGGRSFVGTFSFQEALAGFNGGTAGTTFTIRCTIEVVGGGTTTGTIIDWEDDGEIVIPGERE